MGFTRPASTRMVAVTGFSPANERRPVRYAHYSVYRGISYARQNESTVLYPHKVLSAYSRSKYLYQEQSAGQ